MNTRITVFTQSSKLGSNKIYLSLFIMLFLPDLLFPSTTFHRSIILNTFCKESPFLMLHDWFLFHQD